ncbi:ribulose-phosphate 3-epimerase [Tannockella kyphosi]|uniref:ribulose-phosphate 3-epimerase n=1 Tax=Tannockella kyphosi TaxID=2899121 RepID=UPI0020113092|nr:ribulose-phosphate 3-epimerase [Tannockella kyphosi]
MSQILPSIFGANILKLKEELEFLEDEKTEILHVDMMDGNYVSHIAFGALQISEMKKASTMIFDVHMMVANPKDHLDDIIATGTEMISVHYETTPHIHNMLQRIKKAGRSAGVVLNPGTPISVLECLLDDLDYVLLMSINPGTPGQSFIENTIKKIEDLKIMIGERPIKIEVDGGVNNKNIAKLSQAGADMIVVGGYIFSSTPKQNYDELKQILATEV